MAGKTNQELIQDLIQEAHWNLQQTLAAHDAQVANRRLGAAQRLSALLERMVLANPMGTEQDLEQVVRLTRGTLWTEARAHLAQLSH